MWQACWCLVRRQARWRIKTSDVDSPWQEPSGQRDRLLANRAGRHAGITFHDAGVPWRGFAHLPVAIWPATHAILFQPLANADADALPALAARRCVLDDMLPAWDERHRQPTCP